jgi:transposase-like protein
MKCPKCNSNRAVKNGRRRGKQCYKCQDCGRQFVESPVKRSYPPEVRQLRLKMYLNGMGLPGIERVTEIHHTTVMNVFNQSGKSLNAGRAFFTLLTDGKYTRCTLNPKIILLVKPI